MSFLIAKNFQDFRKFQGPLLLRIFPSWISFPHRINVSSALDCPKPFSQKVPSVSRAILSISPFGCSKFIYAVDLLAPPCRAALQTYESFLSFVLAEPFPPRSVHVPPGSLPDIEFFLFYRLKLSPALPLFSAFPTPNHFSCHLALEPR